MKSDKDHATVLRALDAAEAELASLRLALATLMQQWRSEGFDSAQYANQLREVLDRHRLN